MKMKTKKIDLLNGFLQRCLVLDTESTGLDPREVEICELGTCYIDDNLEYVKNSELYGTNEPIPFAASAKNNISRRMLEGKTLFSSNTPKMLTVNKEYLVAHNYQYDKTILETNLKENIIKDKKWICTFRLAKHLFQIKEQNQDVSYSLNYLRFYLDLDLDDISLHRAGDDAYLCLRVLEALVSEIIDLFEDQIEDVDSLSELVYTLSNSLIMYEYAPFGKYKGQKLEDIATNDPKYLLWCLEKMDSLQKENFNYDQDLDESIRAALDKAI